MASRITVYCSICKIRQRDVDAIIWCSQCEEAFCTDCREHHGMARYTKNHVTISIADYIKLPDIIRDIKMVCDDHDELFIHYCRNHEKPLCKKCTVTSHKDCKEISTLDDVIGSVKTSVAMGNLEQNIKLYLDMLSELTKEKERGIESIDRKKSEIIKEIKMLRTQINSYLDKIEVEFIENMEATIEENKTKITLFLADVNKKAKHLETISQSFRTISQHASNLQAFLGIREFEKILQDSENFIAEFKDIATKDVKIDFQMNQNLMKLQKLVDSFGKINISFEESGSSCGLLPSSKAAQIPSANQLKSIQAIELTINHRIKVQNQTGLPTTSCCVAKNGDLVFACCTSNLLAVHDNLLGTYKYSIPLPYQAFDVAVVNDNLLVVSCGYSSKLLVVDVNNRLITKTIEIRRHCFGITAFEGAIFCCVGSSSPLGPGIVQVDVEHEKITTQIVSENVGFQSFVAFVDKQLCVTTTKKLIMYDDAMKEKWSYDLESPSGVAIDSFGNEFVADKVKNTITVISPDGRETKTFQCTDSYTKNLNGLVYNRQTNQLIAVRYQEEATAWNINYQ